MKRKKLNKILSVLLTGTMIMGIVACGQSASSSNFTESESKSSNEISTTPAASTESNQEEEGLTYPLEDATQLSIWTVYPLMSVAYTDWTQSPWHTGLEKNTGVNVQWTYPVQGATWKEAYNLLLTEEELPNMIGYNVNVTDGMTLIDDGVIYDLSEYIPKYAPDYWAYLNAPGNETLLRDCMSDDGRIHAVYTYYESAKPVTYLGPVIRQDWMEECGLDMPVTLEDWEKVLVAFKDKYGAKLGFASNRYNVGIASGTGAMTGLSNSYYIDDNGQVQCAVVQPEWKESLEVLNRWVEMGLVDLDSFTMKDADVREKVLNNKIGVSITAASQITNWNKDAMEQATGAKWVGMEYPREAEGVPTSVIQSGSRDNGYRAMITTSSSEEELITALKWLNYGYTEEGIMYFNYGTEGVSYTVDANGVVQYTDIVTKDPDGLSEGLAKYTGVASPSMATVLLDHIMEIKNDEATLQARAMWTSNTTCNEHLVPAISYTEEENLIINDKGNAINQRISEMALRFVLGEESLSNFDAFVTELYDMGLQEMLDIRQAAYERYLSR